MPLTPEQEAEKLRISRQGKPGYDVFGKPVKTGDNIFTSIEEAEAAFDPVTGEPIEKKTAANGFGSGVTSEEVRESLFSESQLGPTQEEIRKEATERFQGEIDTVDELFTGLITEARERGAVRLKESLGQQRSISAQRGILGTLRGFGKKREVTEFETGKTTEEIGLLQAESARRKAVILGQIKDRGDLRIEAQKKAKKEGAEAFATFLEGEEAQNLEIANATISGLLQQGLTFDELEEDEINQISENLGVSVPQLETIYRGKLAEVQQVENEAIQDILGEAIRAGADITIQQAIVDAQSVDEALSAAGPAIGELARQKIITEKADRAIKQSAEARARAKAEEIEASKVTSYSIEKAVRTVASVDELKVLGFGDPDDPTSKGTPGIFGRTAALPIPDALRTDAFRNFEAQLDTLKANIAFGELTAMREASKTGGALGQVSNIELALLESSLGALRMSQSPEAFKGQLDKIKGSIERFQAAVDKEGGSISFQRPEVAQNNIITAPDGQQIIITD